MRSLLLAYHLLYRMASGLNSRSSAKSFFDAVDFLVSNILLPVGALLIAIFIPLRMKKEVLYAEFSAGNGAGRRLFAAWLLFIRIVVPFAIVLVFLHALGIFDWLIDVMKG